MALNRERLQSADLVLTCPQPSMRSAAEHTVRSFRPSAMTAGSVGVNATLTDANINATCVGLLVAPDDGAARGLFARIMSVASTTATLDRPLPSVTNVTSVSAWKDPTIPVRVTTADGSAPFDVISTDHSSAVVGTSEPDGYWATGEYLMVGVAGANAGRAALITGFTAATGTFVVAANTFVAISVGELFEIWQLVKLEADVDASVDQKVLERSFMGTGRIAADVPVPITVDGHVSLEMGAKMITTAGASGVAATRPMNVSGMLESCFTRHSDTGGTVVSANATIINSGSSALTQGGFVLLNTGEVVQVLATDDGGAVGVIDVAAYTAGALTHGSVTPGSVMHASCWFEPKTVDFRNQAFALYRGGYHMQRLFGCLPAVTLTIDRENIVRWKLAFTAGESISYPLVRPVALGATAPLILPDNTIPTDPKWSRCLIDGVQHNVSNIAIDFGFARWEDLMPWGVGDLAMDLGFERVIELDWWESFSNNNWKVTFTPSKHWGARTLRDQHRGYGGFILEHQGRCIYHAGDSAYFHGFKEIGRRVSPEIALLPIGAYHPDTFRKVHMGPDQAMKAFKDLRAKQFVPMHYGTFKLSFEEMDEPPRWLLEIAEKEKLTKCVKILDEGAPVVF